jgi:hypothetical protein
MRKSKDKSVVSESEGDNPHNNDNDQHDSKW